MKNKKVAVVGTVGVPANYGGFETLVENLVRYHATHDSPYDLTVYCSSKSYSNKKSKYLSVNLKYIPLKNQGVSRNQGVSQLDLRHKFGIF